MGVNDHQTPKSRRRKKSTGDAPTQFTASAQAAAPSHRKDIGALPQCWSILEGLLDTMRGADDGRFVVCPDSANGAHLYWKWHRGPWAGHYEYWYMRSVDTWTEAFQGLMDKVGAVYGGRRRPMKDTPPPKR